MVLDGAIDPKQTPVQSDLAQIAGFQQAFQTYARDCASKRGCPLGGDAGRATTEFQALTRPLIDRPAAVHGDPRRLSYSDAITAAEDAMYARDLWAELTAGLTQLRRGDGTTLLKLADEYYERRADGSYNNSNDALLVINCLDGERITDHAVAGDLARRTAEVAPFADSGRGPSDALDTCAFLPVTPTGQPHQPSAPGLPPVLVISTTGDPATPYQAGVELAVALHGSLLTVEDTQHTAAASGNPCVDRIVRRYLLQPTAPLPLDRCTGAVRK